MHKKLSITTTEFEKKNAVRNENVDLRGRRRDAIQNMKYDNAIEGQETNL